MRYKTLLLMLFQIVLLVLIAIQLTDYLPELQKALESISNKGSNLFSMLMAIVSAVLGASVSLLVASRTIKITRNKKPIVYISYSHKDKELVYRVLKKMDGLDVRILDDINIGEKIEDYLDNVIKEADFIIVIYTESFANSESCRYELGKLFESGKRIFPLVDEDFLKQENTIEGIIDITNIIKKVKYLSVDKKNIDITMETLVMALNKAYKSMYEKTYKKY